MITRRNLTTGLAWATPVIAIAAIAPQAAASLEPPVTVEVEAGDRCKEPGQSQGTSWGYRIWVKITNNSNTLLSAQVVGATAPGGPAHVVSPTGPFMVPANDSVRVRVTVASSNSANGVGTLTVAVSGYMATTASFTFDGFNPCKKGDA